LQLWQRQQRWSAKNSHLVLVMGEERFALKHGEVSGYSSQ
jgi:hypothetical protein